MLTLAVVLRLMVDGGDKDLEYDVGVHGTNNDNDDDYQLFSVEHQAGCSSASHRQQGDCVDHHKEQDAGSDTTSGSYSLQAILKCPINPSKQGMVLNRKETGLLECQHDEQMQIKMYTVLPSSKY